MERRINLPMIDVDHVFSNEAETNVPFNLLELAGLFAFAAATVAYTLYLVHHTGQTLVSRSVSSSIAIALRLILVESVLAFFFCVLIPMPVGVFVILAGIAVLLAPVFSVNPENGGPGADNILGAAIMIFLFLTLYPLKEFVLGFPERKHVTSSEIPSVSNGGAVLSPPEYKSDTGVVVGTLRPMGNIELAGEKFTAQSVEGKMVDVGTPIRVCGNQGEVLLVEVIEAERDQLDGAEA